MDCSQPGIRAWEDPFDGHHKQKGGSKLKFFLIENLTYQMLKPLTLT